MGIRAAANSAAIARRRVTVGVEEGEVPVAMVRQQVGDEVDVSSQSCSFSRGAAPRRAGKNHKQWRALAD